MKYSNKRPTLYTGQQTDTYTAECFKQNLYNSKISPYKPSLLANSKHSTCCGQQDSSFTPKPAKNYLDRSCKQPQNASKSINVTPDKERNRKEGSFVLPKTKLEELRLNLNALSTASSAQTQRCQRPFKAKETTNDLGNKTTSKDILRQTVSTNSWQYHSSNYPIKDSAPQDIILRRKIESQCEPKWEVKSKFSSRQQSRNNSKFLQHTAIEPNASSTIYTDRTQNKSKTPTKTPRVSQDKLRSTIVPKQRNPMSQTDPNGSYFQLTHSKRLTILKPAQLRIQDFQLGACKGQGRFGKVYPAIHKKTGFLLAIKKVSKESVRSMLDQFVQEIKICLYLNHPNIVRMYGFFCDVDSVYILMEYMEEGSLYHQVRLARKFTEVQASVKLLEVCEAVHYLHSLDILHRDIKPENIVISNGVCKLCDFGWAAYSKDRRNTYCGTLDYVCPQILEGESYDNFVDVWAIGVLAFELLVGKAPFYHISRKETMRSIMNCDFSFPADLSIPAKLFITKSLQKNPDQRFTIESLLRDKFLAQVSREM